MKELQKGLFSSNYQEECQSINWSN